MLLTHRQPIENRLLPAWVLLVLLMGLGGCQYSMGTKHLYDPQYRTVAVPMFENQTLTRGVQQSLSEALIKQLQTRTPYAVASIGGADTVLQGSVVEVERDMISRTRRGAAPQQMELTLRVDFEWRDVRTGEVIRGRQGFEAVGTYIPTAPVYETEEVAIQMAVDRLAEDMVQAMQADWGPTAAP